MKEIELPITQTVSLTFNPSELKPEETEGIENYSSGVSIGTMIDETISSNMKIARKNGGVVLYATTSIEKKLEKILLKYFLGDFIAYDERREIFEKEVLQSSALSYSSKKELVSKVVNASNLLLKNKKSKLQKHLKDIMVWRNAFAHGSVRHDNKKGCFVRFYNGHEKDLELTDTFWFEVEKSFSECSSILDVVIEKIENA